MKIPLKPPMINKDTKAEANSMGVVNCRFPCHRVASQLNVLTADGRAINMVDVIKAKPSIGFMPL